MKCDTCGHVAKNKRGLAIHKGQSHGKKGSSAALPKAEKAVTNGQVDSELEAMSQILGLLGALSPAGKAFIKERL